jgi:hypothetical protein
LRVARQSANHLQHFLYLRPALLVYGTAKLMGKVQSSSFSWLFSQRQPPEGGTLTP